MKSTTSNREPIGKHTLPVESWSPDNLPEGEEVDYIDISSIDRERKTISRTTRITRESAPSRARQLVKRGDVLVSTVRPNLNAVAVIPENLDGAIASTGFCVLRCKDKAQDSRYLFHWLRTPHFITEMVRLATGASYPAVTDRIIKESLLPLPEFSEQLRVANILDRADAIRKKREDAIRTLDELKQSQFEAWFSSWFQPEAERDYVPVSHIVSRFEGGLNVATPKSPTPETRHFILKVSAVTWGDYRPDESKPLPPEFNPPKEHVVRKGDLLFSRANTTELVGATVFVFDTPPNRVLPDKLWRFVWKNPSEVEPLFVWALFNHPKIRYEIGRRATGTSGSMKNISMEKVMSIRVPWPDIETQRRFARFTTEERKLRNRMSSSKEDAGSLFNSLIQRAFRGEL